MAFGGVLGALQIPVVANLAPFEAGLAKAKVEASAAGGGIGKSLIGGFNPAVVAGTLALGGLVVAGKSMIDIGDRWESSQKGLTQATNAAGVSNDRARQFVDNFISSNKNYVSSQSEVVDSYAALIRQGNGATKAQDDLNLALDLSAISGKSLTDSTTLLQQAEMGRGRALIPLGIQMKDYPILQESAAQATAKVDKAQQAVTKAQAAYTAAVKAHGAHSPQAIKDASLLKDATNKLADAHNYAADRAKASAAVHDILHQKLDGGRKKTSDLEQAQRNLGNTWQTFAEHGAPVLLGALTLIFGALNHIFEAIGWVIDRFAGLAGAGESAATKAAAAVNIAAGQQGITTGRFAHPTMHRQHGGDVNPYGDYIVGETGTELLHMGPQRGTIIPHGGLHGGTRTPAAIHVHVDGIYAGDGPSLDILANKIAQRLGYASGR